MSKIAHKTVYRKDYAPPPFFVDSVTLDVDLKSYEDAKISARLAVRRNPKGPKSPDFFLNGQDIKSLDRIAIDGVGLGEKSRSIDPEGLTVHGVPDNFTLETTVTIDPKSNTALMGLYVDGGGMFCTQMEAEGFRRMTYFPDRPDILSRYTCTIRADKASFPVLLSNGNLIDSGDLAGGRHFATWQDPFPKPSYLFALVAGDLKFLEDKFRTVSGRDVVLRMFTQEKNLPKVSWAMESLKHAMAWDEKTFGREYDLDIFMVVVTDYFNFGAMENKGLNIFNASALLASPDTATDARYFRIEKVVAHEYFHNWSGDRVTLRSWFELSLKEGFTVLRDQLFSADMRDADVQRIEDVDILRAAQFPQDAGPMAHPIRPDAYQAIDNFYTTTVYEKGAEVLRMIRTMVGPERFRKGCDLYFSRFDGQAVSCDDFIDAISEGAGIDLSQFRRWYSQAGTPLLTVAQSYDESKSELTLTIRQSVPSAGADAAVLHIPLRAGILEPKNGVYGERTLDVQSGAQWDAATGVIHIKEAEQRVVLKNVPKGSVLSLLRAFSAPVRLELEGQSVADLSTLARFDTDGFNRREALQKLAVRALTSRITRKADPGAETEYIRACAEIVDQVLGKTLSPLLAGTMLDLPASSYMKELLPKPLNLDAIQEAYEYFESELARKLPKLRELYDSLSSKIAYAPETEDAGRRKLRNQALRLITAGGDRKLAFAQFEKADNMTDLRAALSALCDLVGGSDALTALDNYRRRYADDSLSLDTWFLMQAGSRMEGGLGRVQKLVNESTFDWKRPNCVRAVLLGLADSGTRNYDAADGSGYRLFASLVSRYDAINPTTAARMATQFNSWRQLDSGRATHIKAALESIREARGDEISSNLSEVIGKALG